MEGIDFAEILYSVSIVAIPLIVAITLHEAAHGWVAWKLGDDTAKRLGRVTFNPLRHVDPFGTVLLPAILLLLTNFKVAFGFAKPVPVDFSRLGRPRRDMVLVAAAGPAINFAIALAAAAALPFVARGGDGATWLANVLFAGVWFNVLIAVFNLLPLPPLDGGRVAVGILPRPLALPLARLERFGFFIVLAVLFLLPWLGSRVGVDLDVFRWLVIKPAEVLTRAIFRLFGVG